MMVRQNDHLVLCTPLVKPRKQRASLRVIGTSEGIAREAALDCRRRGPKDLKGYGGMEGEKEKRYKEQ